jgi:hypothetical protein
LGTDARLLTEDEPIESFELFRRLLSKDTLTGEDPEAKSELKYLNEIKALRTNDPDLFGRVRRLPRKARTGRDWPQETSALLTFLRRGKLRKFYATRTGGESQELDFISAAEVLEADKDVPRRNLGDDYHDLLLKNRAAFDQATTEEPEELRPGGSRDAATQVLRILRLGEIRQYKGYTDDDDLYLKRLMQELEEGGIAKRTARETLKGLQAELKKGVAPLRILAVLKLKIPPDILAQRLAETKPSLSEPREIILSEYLRRPEANA